MVSSPFDNFQVYLKDYRTFLEDNFTKSLNLLLDFAPNKNQEIMIEEEIQKLSKIFLISENFENLPFESENLKTKITQDFTIFATKISNEMIKNVKLDVAKFAASFEVCNSLCHLDFYLNPSIFPKLVAKYQPEIQRKFSTCEQEAYSAIENKQYENLETILKDLKQSGEKETIIKLQSF